MSTTGVVWGLVFAALGVAVVLIDAGVWTWRPAGLWPALLIVVGTALLIGGIRPRRHDRTRHGGAR